MNERGCTVRPREKEGQKSPKRGGPRSIKHHRKKKEAAVKKKKARALILRAGREPQDAISLKRKTDSVELGKKSSQKRRRLIIYPNGPPGGEEQRADFGAEAGKDTAAAGYRGASSEKRGRGRQPYHW